MKHVTLASPQELLLCGMRTALAADHSLKVDHVDSTPDALIEQCGHINPDIVVLDGRLAGSDTPALLRRLQQFGQDSGIVFIDSWTQNCQLRHAECSRLDGLLHSDDTVEEFFCAVQCVASGGQYRSKRVAALIAEHEKRSEAESRLELLTESERQVLSLLRKNRTSREIAAELYVSYRTVQKHRDNINHKLQLHGNNALLAFALEYAA